MPVRLCRLKTLADALICTLKFKAAKYASTSQLRVRQLHRTESDSHSEDTTRELLKEVLTILKNPSYNVCTTKFRDRRTF